MQAITALFPGASHLSKRATHHVVDNLFGLQRGLGTIRKLEAATAHALAEPGEEARVDVQEQARAHLEETGWRAGGARAWLWVAVTRWVTVFLGRLSRGGRWLVSCWAQR